MVRGARARRSHRHGAIPAAGPLVAALLVTSCAVLRAPPVTTGLEQSGWQRASTPEEIVRFSSDLAQREAEAQVVTIGHSAGGRPLGALLLRSNAPARSAEPRRLTVMLVGSQHGTEPSGGEAIQILAREIVSGPDRAYLDDMDFILVPDSNPDGRAARRRVNANGVNLSTNYALLSEPEARAINDALLRWQPDVVLDVHESAILKKKSLGAQGYMTDFDTQVEYANHPDVDRAIATLSREKILPETIAHTAERGVPAQHYIGEITDVAQPITHGGLSVRNLRNKAAFYGAVSFLIENRLDPPGTEAPTPRNIRERVRKQRIAIGAFLDVCRENRREIAQAVERARGAWPTENDEPVHLVARWSANRERPTVIVLLRRIADGALEERTFPLHDVVEARHPLVPPLAYAVTAHQERIRELLDRHGIEYEWIHEPARATVVALRIEARIPVPARHGWGYTDYEMEERREGRTVEAGTLWIPTRQPARRLITLLLEPRSNSSLLQDPSLSGLLEVGRELFLQRVDATLDARSPCNPRTRRAHSARRPGHRPCI